jgi:hypothetical protein
MNKLVARGWTSLFLMLPVPLLMGAKGGCGGREVSMGSDYTAEAGVAGDDTPGDSGRHAGGTSAIGGSSTTGGKAPGGVAGKGGTMSNAGAAGSAGRAAQCDGFENTDFQDEVTVRYVNDGDKAVYVGRTRTDTCDGGFSYELRDEAGDLHGTGSETCVSCQALQSGNVGCPTICAQGLLVRIEPGGSYDFSWSGTYWQLRDMPKACFATDGFNDCSQLVHAQPAAYRFLGRVWSEVVCDEAQGCIPCTPDGSGSCIVSGFGAVATGTSREVEEALDYPTQKRVELHFD